MYDTNENGVYLTSKVICLPLSERVLVVNSSNSAFVKLTTPTLPVSSHVARNVVSPILITIGRDVKMRFDRNLQLDTTMKHPH